jgi:hypothetical protein
MKPSSSCGGFRLAAVVGFPGLEVAKLAGAWRVVHQRYQADGVAADELLCLLDDIVGADLAPQVRPMLGPQ